MIFSEKWARRLLGVLALANLAMVSLLSGTITLILAIGWCTASSSEHSIPEEKLQLVVVYVDFKLGESYTPSKISILAGDGFHNLKEIKTVELVKPAGWVYPSLSGNDPRETFANTFMLQISVLSNHLNGRDTHVRQIKVYGPRP